MNKDIIRQIVNVVATIATIGVNAFSSLITGRSVGEISNQFPIPITPAGYAFSIWSLIFTGLLAFAVYQALPSQRTNPRLRRISYWYALSCVANIGWIFIWTNELITLSLFAIVLALVAVLILYLRADINRTSNSTIESWCVNAPFGIYLGWLTVATIVNTAVVLFNLGWNGLGISPEVWTALLLVVGTGIGIFVGLTRVDIAYIAVLVWAFTAILVKNNATPLIVVTAALMIAILVGAMALIALRRKELLSTGSPIPSLGARR